MNNLKSRVEINLAGKERVLELMTSLIPLERRSLRSSIIEYIAQLQVFPRLRLTLIVRFCQR